MYGRARKACSTQIHIQLYECLGTQLLGILLFHASALIMSNSLIANVKISKDLLKKHKSIECMGEHEKHAQLKNTFNCMNAWAPNCLEYYFSMLGALLGAIVSSPM